MITNSTYASPITRPLPFCRLTDNVRGPRLGGVDGLTRAGKAPFQI